MPRSPCGNRLTRAHAHACRAVIGRSRSTSRRRWTCTMERISLSFHRTSTHLQRMHTGTCRTTTEIKSSSSLVSDCGRKHGQPRPPLAQYWLGAQRRPALAQPWPATTAMGSVLALCFASVGIDLALARLGFALANRWRTLSCGSPAADQRPSLRPALSCFGRPVVSSGNNVGLALREKYIVVFM